MFKKKNEKQVELLLYIQKKNASYFIDKEKKKKIFDYCVVIFRFAYYQCFLQSLVESSVL